MSDRCPTCRSMEPEIRNRLYHPTESAVCFDEWHLGESITEDFCIEHDCGNYAYGNSVYCWNHRVSHGLVHESRAESITKEKENDRDLRLQRMDADSDLDPTISADSLPHSPDLEARRTQSKALILANLRAFDFDRFHEAGIPYSGSVDPDLKGRRALRIATFESELFRSVEAMKWKKFKVEEKGGQWIVRREHPSR